ncbi:MAG: response regulator transcription factor [Clostridium sp.]|nr:response regulator transcription factor [Clostridium sp.]
MQSKILVVDDEENIAKPICYALEKEGYCVGVAYDGEQALKMIENFKPDILILDIMMPGLNGYDVMRSIGVDNNIGIIMLTAKDDIVDKVLGLGLGADDYITKPFDMRELLARIDSLIRRFQKIGDGNTNRIIGTGDLRIYTEQRRAVAKGRALNLTPKEFDLLALLFTHIDRVYTRDELLELVWGMEYEGGTRTVDIHIQRLRKKLGKELQGMLHTVHGVGYKAIKS